MLLGGQDPLDLIIIGFFIMILSLWLRSGGDPFQSRVGWGLCLKKNSKGLKGSSRLGTRKYTEL
jgi:hypothetical protein